MILVVGLLTGIAVGALVAWRLLGRRDARARDIERDAKLRRFMFGLCQVSQTSSSELAADAPSQKALTTSLVDVPFAVAMIIAVAGSNNPGLVRDLRAFLASRPPPGTGEGSSEMRVWAQRRDARLVVMTQQWLSDPEGYDDRGPFDWATTQ